MSSALSVFLLSQLVSAAAPQEQDPPMAQSEVATPAETPDTSRSDGGATQPPGLFDTLFGTTRDAVEIEGDNSPAADQLNLARLLWGPHELSATLALYPTGAGWCVPAQTLLDALEVEHETAGDRLQVTLYEPLRRHTLALSRLLPSPDGPCLDLEDAGRLTESELAYDPVTLELRLSRSDQLPAVRRIEREVTRAVRMGPKEPGEPSYPTLPNPWQMAGIPTVDIALQGGLSAGKGRFSMLAEGAGDLLWSTARWRLLLGQSAAVRFSGRLEHVAPEGGLLGPLDIRRIELGDVSAPSQSLIAPANQARGLIISSAPEWRAEIFDRIVIEGPLGQGWRAELMIDGRLVGYVDGPDDTGSYRFRDVPLKTGINRFVVELFGPHGERDRREFIRQVGAALFAENETAVTFGVVGGVPGGDEAEADGASQQAPAAVFATISTGITDWASLRADVRQALTLPANGAGLTFDSSILGGALALSLAHRSPGGMGYAAAFSRRLGSWNATMEMRDNGPQPSAWDIGTERDARRISEISVAGPLAVAGMPLAVAFGAESTVTRTGVRRQSMKLGATARTGTLRFNHDLTVDLAPRKRIVGAFTAQWTHRKATARAFATYQDLDGWSLKSAGASFSNQHGQSFYTINAAYDFAAKSPGISLGLNRRIGAVELGAETGWSRASGPTLSVAARFALGRLPQGGAKLLPAGSSRVATLAARMSGEDDEAIAGGRYLVANSLRTETGGRDGVTVLGGLPTYRPISLALQLSSLEDERLRPDREGTRVTLRPGQVLPVPIRLAPTGTIEIRLIHGSGERQDPVTGLAVSLTSESGDTYQAQSDFDGYAFFDGLPFGNYIVRGKFGGVTREQALSLSSQADDLLTTLRF